VPDDDPTREKKYNADQIFMAKRFLNNLRKAKRVEIAEIPEPYDGISSEQLYNRFCVNSAIISADEDMLDDIVNPKNPEDDIIKIARNIRPPSNPFRNRK
jgi:hypothetical protein